MYERQLLEVDVTYKDKVTTLEIGLQDAKATVNFLQKKLATIIKAQAWAKAQVQRSKGLESLATKSGNAKKKIMKICELL